MRAIYINKKTNKPFNYFITFSKGKNGKVFTGITYICRCGFCEELVEIKSKHIKQRSRQKNIYCSLKCKGKESAGENHHFWGESRSEETKEKISISNKKHHREHPERARKHSEDLTGKPSPMKGKTFSKEARRNMSAAMKRRCSSKENHPRWIDGRTIIKYPPEWNNNLKTQVKERDNNQCVLCGVAINETGRKGIHIHHIDKDVNNCKLYNLVTLCGKCHRQLHFGKPKNNMVQLFMAKMFYNYTINMVPPIEVVRI